MVAHVLEKAPKRKFATQTTVPVGYSKSDIRRLKLHTKINIYIYIYKTKIALPILYRLFQWTVSGMSLETGILAT